MQVGVHAKAGMRSLIQIANSAKNPDQIHSADSSRIEMHSAIGARALCFLMAAALYRVLLGKHSHRGTFNWVPFSVRNEYVPVRGHDICCGEKEPNKHQC